MFRIKIIFVILLFFPFLTTHASSISERLSGKILLNVNKNGEAWYVNPDNNKRYYLGRPIDAFNLMRELGLGITEKDFQKIAQVNMKVDGDLDLAKKLSGKILLRVNKNGEAWYINPDNLKKYYLGRPKDAFSIMRELGLGISQEDLASIHKDIYDESINKYSKYEYNKTIITNSGNFSIDMITIDLDNPNLKIITDTASSKDCDKDCPAKTLAEFTINNNGFASINGTYFDTSASKKNYYFFPVFNSNLKKLINQDQLKYWTTGPIMAFDTENNFYYFKDSRDFESVEKFEKTFNKKLQAAIGNKPRLIEQKANLLIDWELDKKQRVTKTLRNALAFKDIEGEKGELYLIIARKATVPDLANIMKAMDIDYAINLDGGYSSALFYNDEYMIGPGRNIPNAIIFSDNSLK